jgi:PAS domain S-box-containing protein
VRRFTVHISREWLASVLLGCFSVVATVVFAITATQEPLPPVLAGPATVVFGLFLLCQQWILKVVWQRLGREHRDCETFQGRLTAAAATCGGWLYVLDAESRFVYCSDASLDYLGYAPGELIGTEARALLAATELEQIDPSLAAEQVNTLVVRGRHRNGEDRWFEVTIAPVTDPTTREVLGWSGTARVLTEKGHPGILREIHRRAVTEILRSEQLVIAFQPIVDLATGGILGVEALSRFPSQPLATPDVVFAQANNAGLGTDLELLALRRALAEARMLDPSLYVSINISPPVLAKPSLPDALIASGLDLRRVIIEVTEHASIADYTVLERPRQRLRDLGVRLAIDDAGAGYASLRHIVALAPDMIKIDRALVSDVDSDRARRALVMAVVMFGMEIGATTIIAEGVETAAELDALKSLGVDAAQGYLIGRPTTSPEDWLRWSHGAPLTAPA